MARKIGNSPPRSRAFFFEMLLNMLIFAICATVALQVFVESKVSIDRSAALTYITLEAETLAETYKSSSGEISDLAEILGIKADGTPVITYYDSELQPCSIADAKYSLECTINKQEPVSVAKITAYEENTQLFQYEVKNYQPRKAGS